MTTMSRYFLPTIRNYHVSKDLFPDLVAGLTVGSLAIPQAMSNAFLAGLPVQYGLYGVIAPAAYALFGQSSTLVVGPIAITALLTKGSLINSNSNIEPYTEEWIKFCAIVSFLVGVQQLIVAFLGLSPLIVNLFSRTTIKSFAMSGIFTLLLAQFKDMIGCSLKNMIFYNASISWETLVVSLLSIVFLELCRPLTKLGSLVLILFGCMYMLLVDPRDVPSIGYIPEGLPSIHPVWSYIGVLLENPSIMMRLLFSSWTIGLISFTEAFAVEKSLSKAHSEINANQELASLGITNIVASLLGSYPVTGSFSRTAINIASGSKSALSNVFAAGLVFAVLAMLTDYLSLLPKACIASIVFSATIRVLDFRYLRSLIDSGDYLNTAKFLFIFVCGTALGVEFGLGIGVVLDIFSKIVKKKSD